MDNNKKTFGMFILQRRRELGLTQKEFASRLFVTESAVSKWERGLSYPDITLLQNICAVLEVSEHELLSGSEDTRQRDSFRLAERYIKLCRNTRLSQYIFYGAILLICAIVNLSVAGRLDWFFIALFSVLMCASLTLTPSLCALSSRWEPRRRLLSLGGFTLSLELLLLSCCLYLGENWFGWAGIAVLFGLSLVFLPFLLRSPLLPEKYRRCKLSLYLASESLMLLLLLLVCSFYTGGSWFTLTACALLFGLGLFFLPVFLRQFPLPQSLESRKFSLYAGIETALLLLLLLVSCIHTGGSWFILAAVSTLFGIGLVLLPPVLRQLRLPGFWGRNLLLLYFSLESLLLLLIVVLGTAAGSRVRPEYYLINVLVCLIPMALPWGVMLCLRYLPVSRPLRCSAACGFTALWLWTWPFLLDAALAPVYGWREGVNNYSLATPFANALPYGPWTWYAGLIVLFAAAALVLLCLGISRHFKSN